jgi:hypothetical protein
MIVYQNLLKLVIFTNLLFFVRNKFWSPEDLANEFTKWNTITDPENLLKGIKISEKINNYLNSNKVYEKIDLNIFIIPSVIDDNIYRGSEFASKLMKKIDNKDITPRRSSYLTLIFCFERSKLIIKSSNKVDNILDDDIKKLIIANVEELIRSKKKEKSILFLFEELDLIWKKFKISNNEKYPTKKNILKNARILDEIGNFIISSITIFLLLLSCLGRKFYSGKSNKFDNIKLENKCSICLVDFQIEKDNKNLLHYEDINIENISIKDGNYIAVLKCGHGFHAICIQTMDEKNIFDISCPVCRQTHLEDNKNESDENSFSDFNRNNVDLINEPG